jgi:phospholipid/cholesterol/gamma-HCH transport system ATP-binding protein
MTQKKIIEVRALSKFLGDREILTDISFDAYERDITVILGGSGAGKSVLLKHLLGLYIGEVGTVHILDKNIAELEEENLKHLYIQMGVFFQNGGLLNSLTVGENIALPLEQHTNLNDELIKRVVLTKLQLVNLTYAYYLYPSQLSGGMLKRAALARAIVMDPPVLFCDEPGAGLDPISLATLDELILNLRQQMGMSIVIITHEISSILRIADRIIFIDKGEKIFQGSLKEALESNIDRVHTFFQKGRSIPENPV